MVRLVLFDIDGTLIHTGGAGMKAFARAFAAEFQIANGTEQLKFAGRTDTGLVREFFLKHTIDPSPENFRRFFESYIFWLDRMLAESEGGAFPGVRPFLRELKMLERPPAVGLLTGNIRRGAELKLRRFAMWDQFKTGAFADDHEERDQIAVIARQRGGELLKSDLRGQEILVIGDTPLDVRCGRAIEARVLAVATGASPADELRSHRPDWVVEDLRAISVREVCGY